MKYHHVAIMYEIDGKELSYVLRVSKSENLVATLASAKAKHAQICDTFKEAGEVATFWNECSRKNGKCAI